MLAAAEPQRGAWSILKGYLKWVGLVVLCIPLWLAQLVLLLVGATIGCGPDSTVVVGPGTS